MRTDTRQGERRKTGKAKEFEKNRDTDKGFRW